MLNIADESAKLLSRGYRTRLVVIMVVASILNYADRTLLYAIVEPMRRDLGFSDSQIGLLQGLAFGIIYSALTLPIARLAERASRVRILTCSVAFFSAASALCGLAANFGQLFILRTAVGAGEAAYMAPASSLLSDHFSASRRASIMTMIGLGAPIGYFVGSSMGGWIAANWGWRMVFFASAIPGAIVSLAIYVLLREPPRGLADCAKPESTAPPSLLDVLRMTMPLRAFRHILAGSALVALAINIVMPFQVPFFIRAHGLPLAQAGFLFGIITLFSGVIGILMGGLGADFARRFDMRWYAWVPAIGSAIAAVAFPIAFLTESLPVTGVSLLAGGIASAFYMGPSYAMIQNMVGPRMRASVVGLMAMLLGIIGSSFGPTLLGVASDQFASHIFGADYVVTCLHAPGGVSAMTVQVACDAASSNGLRYALACAGFFMAWSALHYALAARTVIRDMKYMSPGAT